MALREWLDSTGGKIVAGVVLALGLVAVVWAVRSAFGPPAEVTEANTRVFVDVSTGKPFRYELKAGDMIPVKAPSGQQTGYPAEMCWWTKEGTIREEPFAVVLNEEKGEPGPTFCPDCGRLVRGHNPRPQPGDKPPPTKAEYKPPRGGQQQDDR
jgi:hypothetical protein